MNARIPTSPRSLLVWFAMVGAPVAWGTQFTVGYWVSQAHCSLAGQSWDISQDAWATVLMAAALAAALCALLAAAWLLRGTRDVDKDDDPPAGRIHFMALVGLAVAPLFIALIAMTGGGVLTLSCNQS